MTQISVLSLTCLLEEVCSYKVGSHLTNSHKDAKLLSNESQEEVTGSRWAPTSRWEIERWTLLLIFNCQHLRQPTGIPCPKVYEDLKSPIPLQFGYAFHCLHYTHFLFVFGFLDLLCVFVCVCVLKSRHCPVAKYKGKTSILKTLVWQAGPHAIHFVSIKTGTVATIRRFFFQETFRQIRLSRKGHCICKFWNKIRPLVEGPVVQKAGKGQACSEVLSDLRMLLLLWMLLRQAGGAG